MHGHRSRVRVVSVTGRLITLVDWPHPVVGDLVDPGGEFLVGAAGLPVGQGRGEVVESLGVGVGWADRSVSPIAACRTPNGP